MAGDERLRLFCALSLPEGATALLARWQRDAFGDARDVRVVAPENLHVTLAFLGATRARDVSGILAALREAAAEATVPIVLSVQRYRETRSAGMLVFGDEDGRAAGLASRLGERLEALGVYRPERRPWLPHVTVVRFRARPRLELALPDLGEVVPSEAALYHSVLRPTGAQYEEVQSVALGG